MLIFIIVLLWINPRCIRTIFRAHENNSSHICMWRNNTTTVKELDIEVALSKEHIICTATYTLEHYTLVLTITCFTLSLHTCWRKTDQTKIPLQLWLILKMSITWAKRFSPDFSGKEFNLRVYTDKKNNREPWNKHLQSRPLNNLTLLNFHSSLKLRIKLTMPFEWIAYCVRNW